MISEFYKESTSYIFMRSTPIIVCDRIVMVKWFSVPSERAVCVFRLCQVVVWVASFKGGKAVIQAVPLLAVAAVLDVPSLLKSFYLYKHCWKTLKLPLHVNYKCPSRAKILIVQWIKNGTKKGKIFEFLLYRKSLKRVSKLWKNSVIYFYDLYE